MSYQVVDLFCGAGGMSYGFLKHVDPGAKIIWAVDRDPDAVETYKANINAKQVSRGKISIDALRIRRGLLEDRGVLLVGPPCQEVLLERRLYLVLEAVYYMKPQWIIIMENASEFFEVFCEKLKLLSYYVDWKIVDASFYGIPQRRRKLILQARRDCQPKWGEPSKERVRLSELKWAMWCAQCSVEDRLAQPHYCHRPSRKLKLLFKNMPPGGTYKEAEKILGRPVCRRGYRRLSWEEPAFTINTKFHHPANGTFIHPDEPRLITLREAALIQDFPIWWKFHGHFSSVRKQIGNAFPPGMMRAVMK